MSMEKMDGDLPACARPMPFNCKKIAMVGIGCRCPGDINTVDAFWDVLYNGKDVIKEVLPDRWSLDAYHHSEPGKPGYMNTRRCGLLSDIYGFDHAYFRISPREAAMMDPHQRHALEVTQEAFDDAGISTDVVGNDCGVFLGIGHMDYLTGMIDDKQMFNPYALSGVAHSVAANRISFAFNLQGPSYAVDTACAASMTALHLACSSLWLEECKTAVVIGCNTTLQPEITVGFSALSVLAPDGVSRPFDAAAQGYVRSEGFGAMILKPLDDAIADGDHIYCTVIGSAISENGHNQSLTMPCPDAQLKLMRTAYSRFGVPMSEVCYVEAHGTGTPVGDPIEANAIGRAFKRKKDEKPMAIGSAKSNFGHLECSSGAIGTIKAALMLHEKTLVPSINYTSPNPDIDLDALNIKIQTEIEPLPKSDKPNIIGVNSFGFGGALAHAILEEHKRDAKPEGSAGWKFGDSEEEGSPLLIPLSAKSEAALKDYARAWLTFSSEKDAQGIVSWLAQRRTHYECKMAIIANSGKDFRDKLQCYIDDTPKMTYTSSSSSTYLANGEDKRVCFVYPGQGQQWANMGCELYKHQKVYRDAIDECDNIFEGMSGWSLLKKYGVFVDGSSNGKDMAKVINETIVSPPAIVFHQVGMTKLWLSWGIKPDSVVGHSLGEVAAAFASGGITLEEAIAVTYARSQAQATMSGNGAMAAVRMSPEEAKKLCSKHEDIYIACVNSPKSVTIAGHIPTIDNIAKDNPTTVKKLRVNSAYHTRYMEPIKEEFVSKVTKYIKCETKTTLNMMSTVTGQQKTEQFDVDYWWDTIRQPVLFSPAVECILENGCDVFLELGASATLLNGVNVTAKECGKSGALGVASGQREKDDAFSMLAACAQLYVNNVKVDWGNLTNNCPVWTSLPNYPWQHVYHWAETEIRKQTRLGLVDNSFKSTNGEICLKEFPLLADHVVMDNITFPAASYIENIIQRCTDSEDAPPTMTNIKFKNILLLNGDDKDKKVHVELEKRGKRVTLSTGSTLHMEATIDTALKSDIPSQPNGELENPEDVDKEQLYESFIKYGLNYGPEFQVLEDIKREDGKATAKIVGHNHNKERIGSNLLEGCFQLVLAASQTASAYLPVGIKSLSMTIPNIPKDTPLRAFVQITDIDPSKITANIQLISEDTNTILVFVEGFEAQNINTTTAVEPGRCIYETKWQPMNGCLPPIEQIADDVFSEKSLRENFPHDMAEIDKVAPHIPLLKAVCAAYARRALQQVPESLHHERNDKYIARLKQIVKNDTMQIPDDKINDAVNTIHNASTYFQDELNMFITMGEMLSETLQEPSQCVHVLFKQEFLPRYFLESLSTQIYYKAGAEIVRRGVEESLKHKKVVRVLEVGGRMGGMSQHMLKPLKKYIDEERVEYVFTDLYNTFFPHAQQTLEGYTNIKYRQLDIEMPVKEQGFVPGTFDIIVSMDHLHSAIDLPMGLGNMKDLLIPGGWLLLYEGTDFTNIAEITFGSLKLCWVFEDFRKDVCWLDQKSWVDFLAGDGFDDVRALTTPCEFFHSIMIGKKSLASEAQQINDPGVLVYDSSANEKMAENDVVTSVEELQKEIADSKEKKKVVYKWNEDSTLKNYMGFLQGIGEDSNIDGVTVVVDSTGEPTSALPVGFTRAAANGITSIPICSITTTMNNTKLEDVVKQIRAGPYADSELQLVNDKLMVPRMVRSSISNQSVRRESGEWFLDFEGAQTIDNIVFREQKKQALAPHEICVKTRAAGVNYKDAMVATGNLRNLGLEQQFGLECAGEVTEIGAGVLDVKVGDNVIAFSDNCFASEVVCDGRFAAKIPDNISLLNAAGLGIVFATAYHALVERADLQAGETVLIHSACGGLGQAAIQIAKMLGSNIICSAGTEEKRKLLRTEFGIKYVTDSRSLGFAEDVMKWTDGEGVDVILNSLSGDYITKGIESLAPGGRFCEIGKRDIMENSSLEMQPFLENKSLMSVQTDVMMKTRPGRMKQLLSKVMAMFDEDKLVPNKTDIRHIRDYKDIFHWMSTGEHSGKIVFDIPSDFEPESVLPSPIIFKEDASYIITGGSCGVGLALARWMNSRGARHIGLVSKSGCIDFKQACTLEALTRQGCKFSLLKADVSNSDSLALALNELVNSSGAPLKGVFHLSGLRDDCEIANLSTERLNDAIDAKATGAEILNDLTKDMGIDHFVMFSSITTNFANREQCAYTAGNAYLDELAVTRRAKGLPALSVQWGSVRGAGILERNAQLLDTMEENGLKTLHINECLDFLARVLQSSDVPPVIAIANMDWQAVQDTCRPETMIFRHLIPEEIGKKVKCESSREELQARVIAKLAETLCTPVDQIDINRAMTDYGIDSLMAVEMVQWINKETGLTLSQLDVLGGISTALLLDRAMEGKVGMSSGNV